MSAPIFNVNGSGFKGAAIPSSEAGLAGFYYEGKPYKPERESLRALLPYRWRKALDRAGPFWWRDDRPAQGYVTLHDRRGRYLTTVYVNGVST